MNVKDYEKMMNEKGLEYIEGFIEVDPTIKTTCKHSYYEVKMAKDGSAGNNLIKIGDNWYTDKEANRASGLNWEWFVVGSLAVKKYRHLMEHKWVRRDPTHDINGNKVTYGEDKEPISHKRHPDGYVISNPPQKGAENTGIEIVVAKKGK